MNITSIMKGIGFIGEVWQKLVDVQLVKTQTKISKANG